MLGGSAQISTLPETWAHGVFLVVPLPPTALRLIVWFSTSMDRTKARPFGPLTTSPMFAGRDAAALYGVRGRQKAVYFPRQRCG